MMTDPELAALLGLDRLHTLDGESFRRAREASERAKARLHAITDRHTEPSHLFRAGGHGNGPADEGAA